MLPHDRDHTWRDDANCWEVDTELFYPPRDKALYKTIADQAKVYCFGGTVDETVDINGKVIPAREVEPCISRLSCLWSAVRTDEQHGIWGGLSHRERNALVRKWQKKHRNEMTLKEYIYKLENN